MNSIYTIDGEMLGIAYYPEVDVSESLVKLANLLMENGYLLQDITPNKLTVLVADLDTARQEISQLLHETMTEKWVALK